MEESIIKTIKQLRVELKLRVYKAHRHMETTDDTSSYNYWNGVHDSLSNILKKIGEE